MVELPTPVQLKISRLVNPWTESLEQDSVIKIRGFLLNKEMECIVTNGDNLKPFTLLGIKIPIII